MYVIISFNEGEIRVRKITENFTYAIDLLNKLNNEEKQFEHDIQIYREET